MDAIDYSKNKTMKTFSDLIFKPHPTAKMFFDNGYGVSVVRFNGSYTSNDSEWELAVLFGTPDNWEITYNTSITDDVIGHLSDIEVTEIMKQVQQLKP